MQLTSFRLDSITFTSILPICSPFVAFKWGMDIHRKITRYGFILHVIIIITLTFMYSKCESITKENSFYKMHHRKIISWNSMIGGYERINDCRI